MISHLSGTILIIKPPYVILDVHGVGYRVYCTQQTLDLVKKGEETSFHTHLAVREDALDIFGFPTPEELELFTLLIGISGIGPRSALGIISLDAIEKLVGAIANGDVAYLTKVSGVGRKSAEKIVLELKEKVTVLDISAIGDLYHEEEDVLEALKSLGYRSDEAREALHQIPDDIEDPGARIKEALQLLSRN